MEPSCSNETNDQANNKQLKYPNSFNDKFEQLLLQEISPQIWLSVYRSKSMNASVFIDIRQKRERRYNGERTLIPTKFGVFLRRQEFDQIKDIFEAWTKGLMEPEVPHEIKLDGRKVTFTKDGERYKISLNTNSKFSGVILSAAQMKKLVSYSLAENLATILAEMNWV